MSFKRMRLVNDDDDINEKQDKLYNIAKYQSPLKLQRMSDLDKEIDRILNSNINERVKAKLYAETLRQFLIYKNIDDKEVEPVCVPKFDQIIPKKTYKKQNNETSFEELKDLLDEINIRLKQTEKRNISDSENENLRSRKKQKPTPFTRKTITLNDSDFEENSNKSKIHKKIPKLIKTPKKTQSVKRKIYQNLLQTPKKNIKKRFVKRDHDDYSWEGF